MTTPPTTPRIAVLGSGGWGRNHVRTWHDLGALTLVCDPAEDRLAQIAPTIPGVDTSLDPGEAFERDDIDGVVLATPAPTHAELAIRAMEAGKDVLVEKPLAVAVPAAEAMVAAAARTGRLLMVGHVLEYHPAVLALHDLLERGELGRLRWLYSNRLNLGRVRTAEDVLWSFSPHDIALLLRLAGDDPQTVSCRGGSYLSPGIADTAFLGLSFPGGVEAQVFASWLHPFKEQRLVVVGEEAMAVFDDTKPSADKLTIHPYRIDWSDPVAPMTERGDARSVAIADTAPLTAECQHFLDRIVDREQPLTDGPSGLRVLRVLDAGNRSMAAGGASVPLPVAGFES